MFTSRNLTAATAAAVVAFVSVLATCLVIAGPAGACYLALFVLTGLPGLPLGLALFGRRHVAAWIAGLAVGYALTTLVWSIVIALGYPTTLVFMLSWAALVTVAWVVARPFTSPLVELPRWTKRDSAALCLLLLLVPIVVARPFSRLGSADTDGNLRYRAYFTADFVWHTALAAELARHEPRPRNPFMAAEPLHYYWTYFRIPATISAQSGMDVQTVLKLNATGTALLFLAAIYLAAWVVLPAWPRTTAAAVAFAFLCPSAEGLAAIVDLLRRGQSLSALRDLNIDAVASWAFKGVRIDNLPRAMWYNPQHSFSCALGLLAVPVALWGGSRPKAAAITLTGVALGGSIAFNPLLGAAFCAIYASAVFMVTVTRGDVRSLAHQLWAVPPIAFALVWCVINQVGDGAGRSLVFGLWGSARNATLLNLLLQLGPILLLMVPGLRTSGAQPFTGLWPAIGGVTLGLLLMHFVALTVSPAWVGFRGGQVFLVMAPAIIARGLVNLWTSPRRSWGVAAVTLAIVGGVPTSIIDLYNAQDVTNRGLSPGAEFHWTILVTPAEQQALNWLRTNTPPDAVVQADPIARARETWSYIPTFAERRMATGTPIALIPEPAAAGMNERVRAIYASDDSRSAWREAKSLGIDYLYVGAVERAAYPSARKFRADAERFALVFGNEEAEIYAVRP